MSTDQRTSTNGMMLRDGLLQALTRTYAQVLGRQGRTTTPFVRCSRATNRAHDFTWVGGVEGRELLMHGQGPLKVGRTSPLFEAVHKMHATANLNPYERKVLYGYVIGRHEGETIRGPLLTLAIRIEAARRRFLVARAFGFHQLHDPTIVVLKQVRGVDLDVRHLADRVNFEPVARPSVAVLQVCGSSRVTVLRSRVLKINFGIASATQATVRAVYRGQPTLQRSELMLSAEWAPSVPVER
jgi:hypothetical protein